MATDISDELARLPEIGGDTASYEVKAAGGGLSPSLPSSLSALANLPGGGVVILGLDERLGFRPVGLADPNALRKGLADTARSCRPPVQLDFIDDAIADGAPVVYARVRETDRSAKPCRTSAGKAYIRGFDGDYELSSLEEQAFLAQRTQPTFDRDPVDGATIADLDVGLVVDWAATVRARDREGLGRFTDDDELLMRGGVISPDRVPTVGGLLALGVHPQQWFPRFVVQVAAAPGRNDPAGTRAVDAAAFSGPVPRMMAAAMAWAQRNMAPRVVGDQTGTVRDEWPFPLEAIREMLSNALIHRDLDHWSRGRGIEVRLSADRFVVSNPGGLWGTTVDRLGVDKITSARNANLLTICQNVRLPNEPARVVEALATGIPTINESSARAGLLAPLYIDRGISFTTVLRNELSTRRPSPRLAKTAQRVYDTLGAGPLPAAEIARRTALSEPNVRRYLRQLVADRLVEQLGGRGRSETTYRQRGSEN